MNDTTVLSDLHFCVGMINAIRSSMTLYCKYSDDYDRLAMDKRLNKLELKLNTIISKLN